MFIVFSEPARNNITVKSLFSGHMEGSLKWFLIDVQH